MRFRPLNKIERGMECPIVWDFNKTSCVENMEGRSKKWELDHIFPPNTMTEPVYKAMVVPLVKQAIEGYNGTMMVYGQTSSGKTHTM